MHIFLKPAAMHDIDELRELSVRTYYETFTAYNTPENMEEYLNRAFDREKLHRQLADKNVLFFLLYFDEKPAGYLKLNEAPAQTDINDTAALEIERIYVSKAFQGEGLGRYLMDKAISLAVQRRKKYVWLGVWEQNEKALRFYKRYGFYRIGRHSFVMGDDEQTDYIMRKDINHQKKI